MNKQAMLAEVGEMKKYFDRSTKVLVEADSTFAPKEGMFTVSQVAAHVAQTVDWFFKGAYAAGGFDLDFERLNKDVLATHSLTAARDWMNRACADAIKAIESHTDAQWAEPLPQGPVMGGLPRYAIFSALIDHTAHHRGALTVYSRLLGKVPAMPYADM